MTDSHHLAVELAEVLGPLDLPARIRALENLVSGRIVCTTSFGLEDQALTHALFHADSRANIMTLDTGRLFPETYDVWAETEAAFGLSIQAVSPERRAAEDFVARRGINGFRGSLEARQECCGFRKVEPLRRALAGGAVWLTGLRAGQSAHRAATPLAEVDESHGLIKVSPLADWSRDDVERYVHDHAVPYNVLHDRGFPSIGCAPCTRAVRIGESERAGRWWWEAEAKKECGLHLPSSHAGEEPSVFAPAHEARPRAVEKEFA